MLFGGRAGDVFGRRRLFLAGIALFTAASMAGGLAGSVGLLLGARVAQGIGSAMAGPSTLALLTTTFTGQRARVRALALFSAMASSGLALGLIFGGMLTQWLSWRAVLFINVPVGALVTVLGARMLTEPPRHAARLDVFGALTATGGMAAMVYGFIRAASNGFQDGLTIGSLGVGVAVLAAFLVIEVRVSEPLLPLRLFGDRNRAAAYINFVLGPAAGMSMFFFLTQYLQRVHGYGALATGLAFLPYAGLVFGVTRLVPRLLSAVGAKSMTLVGAAFMVAGMVLLARLTPESAYVSGLLPPIVLIGIGSGLAMPPLNVIIMSTVPSKDAGSAGGALQTMQQIGATLGLAVLVTVFGHATRDVAGSPTQVLVTGITAAFTGAAVIAALTFLVALTFRRRSVNAR